MNKSKSKCPVTFCEDFTRRELEDLRAKQIWNSWHPVMERLLTRTEEMATVYHEMTMAKGVSLCETNVPFRLILEAIWASRELFSRDTIGQKKEVAQELARLHKDVVTLSDRLSEALQRQRELLETEGFSRNDYLGCVDLLTRASHGNGHYSGWLKKPLEQLKGQFDGKYWPVPEDIVSAIGSFESEQSLPEQDYLPEEVMKGRSSVLKDFVVGFDNDLVETPQIPQGFQFSNAAMAAITNVVLDLPIDNLATEEAVRVIRHRMRTGKY